MSYDAPVRESYFFPSSAFGATTETQKIIGPTGKKGLVRDIITDLSADAVGTTTVPEICVGATSGAVEYARHRLGTTAILGNTAAGTPYRASALVDGNPNEPGAATLPGRQSLDYSEHVVLEKAFIPADTAVFLTRKAGTGGAPAGTGRTQVIIEWF
jgi:hypothetical protein